MLGATIGKNVRIDKKARLGEFDLLTLRDGCCIDTSLVRGFCVERDGYFRLDKIVVGRRAFVNTFTQLSPGAIIPDGAVYGPHASSYDEPSHKSSAAYNRTMFRAPHWLLQVFIAWPIIVIVNFGSCKHIQSVMYVFTLTSMLRYSLVRRDLADARQDFCP